MTICQAQCLVDIVLLYNLVYMVFCDWTIYTWQLNWEKCVHISSIKFGSPVIMLHLFYYQIKYSYFRTYFVILIKYSFARSTHPSLVAEKSYWCWGHLALTYLPQTWSTLVYVVTRYTFLYSCLKNWMCYVNTCGRLVGGRPYEAWSQCFKA